MNIHALHRPDRRSRPASLRRGLAVAAGCLLVATGASAGHKGHYVVESVEISDFYVFNTPTKASGAVILTRDYNNNVVDVSLSTNALQPGYAYSIWIAVFNNPWFCSDDDCGVNDLPGVNPMADARIKPSVFYGGGFVADAAGHANASLKIVPGRTNRELFAATKNYGLQRLWGPEIHVVLRTHGPALPDRVAEQIGTASGACNPTCANVFGSFHPPRN